MKRDSVKELLESVRNGEKEVDEILDSLMDEHGKDVNEAKNTANEGLKKAKSELDKANDRIAELSKEREQAELANLTQEEQFNLKMKALEERQAELDKATNRIKAATMLQEAGVVGEDAESILDKAVFADFSETEAIISAFTAALANQAAKVEADTRKAMLGETPKPSGSQVQTGSVDQGKFDAMSYTERLQVYNESPDLYNQLVNGE